MSRKSSELRGSAEKTVLAYVSPAAHFAFTTYDVQGDALSPLSPADVLMANLLSLNLGWQEVVPLFAEGEGPAQEMRKKLDTALADLAESRPFENFNSLEELEESVTVCQRRI